MKTVTLFFAMIMTLSTNAFSATDWLGREDWKAPEMTEAEKVTNEKVMRLQDSQSEFHSMVGQIGKGMDDNEIYSEISKLIPVILESMTEIKKDCEGKTETPVCKRFKQLFEAFIETGDRMKEIIAEADASEAEEKNAAEYAASPEGLKKRACQKAGVIAAAKGSIAYQNEVQKESGTSNLIQRNLAGRAIVDSKMQLNETMAQYKKKTGKSLDLKSCTNQ